jgi:hypothetical protein
MTCQLCHGVSKSQSTSLKTRPDQLCFMPLSLCIQLSPNTFSWISIWLFTK